MFRALVVLASLISAAAFAPVARRMTSSSLKMSFENELGAIAPVGFFDPLGMIHIVIAYYSILKLSLFH